MKCHKCGKNTKQFKQWYNKNYCLKCLYIVRKVRSIRINGNKIIKDIIRNSLEKRKQ